MVGTPLTVTAAERRAFDAVDEVIVITDREARIVVWNAAAERLYGWKLAEVAGRRVLDVVPTEQTREQSARVAASTLRGESWEGELAVRHRDGTPFVVWVSGRPYRNEAGEITGTIGLSGDITAARAAGRHTALLTGLTPILGASLDYGEAADQVCRFLVPAFADVAAVNIVEEPHGMTRLAVVAVDPKLERLVRESPVPEPVYRLVQTAISTGRAQIVIDYQSFCDPAHAERDPMRATDDLPIISALVAPMAARGKVFGAITFGMLAPSGRSFGPMDKWFAEAVGLRVGLAIENARLHTSLRASEAIATEAHVQALAAEARKDTFLAMLGHELRNPLAPIVSALDRMKMRRPPGREEAIIGRQVAHMVKLVDDLLDVSRVSRRELNVVREPLEISRIVNTAIEMTGPLLKQRSHDLAVDVPDRGLMIDGDPKRLAQVVSNLLTNAAKYTDPGGHIRLRAWREGGDVVLSVADDGTGIDASALAKVFEPFVQAPQALDRAQGGLGVGLTLSRYLVDLHGGTLEATSDGLGCGSEFVVRIPSATGSIPPRADEVDELPLAIGGDGRRVLLVDDNVDALELLAENLRLHGHEVTTAEDGHTALRLAASLTLDVAVLDIGLPGMDGYELAQRLQMQAPSISLVALTGYGQPEDRALTAGAGFAAHLLKPIDLDLLREAIARKGQ